MNFTEILSILWHRKLVVIGVTVLAIAGAVGALRVVTPEYQATATVALEPQNLSNDLVFFQTIDVIIPIYAAAADSGTTLDQARARNGGRLAAISVRTFKATPIFKIDARGTDQALVRASAQSVTNVLRERVNAGQVGIPSLRMTEIDQPSFPTSPVFPNKKLTFAIALLLGLGFGAAAALLQERFGSRVRTRADLAEASGLSIYAELPRDGALARGEASDLLTNSPALRSINEALRDLRTNLAFAGDGEIQTVAVTSPEGSHGKTTVALGLAVAIARSGSKTLLIDADLRRGRVAEMLDMPRVPGLYEAMNASHLGPGIVRKTVLPNLDLITGGRLVSDPGELLATRFSDLLTELGTRYDSIVIDTTPLIPVNDARVVASLVKATVLVASSGGVTGRAVEEAVSRLSLIGVSPTAAVLNKSRSRQASGYYGTGDSDRADDGHVVQERV
ncbi:MAG: polysaccharide biosynthesis tyrosine autokinase [Actinomycetota bacterium]